MKRFPFLCLFIFIFVLCQSVNTFAESDPKNTIENSFDGRIHLTEEEEKWLEQNHVVRTRVGDNPPLHFNDGQNRGVSVEYLNLIAEKVGFQVEYVYGIPWPDALENIKKQETVDLLLTAKNVKERRPYMRFSDDYLLMPWVIFSRTDSTFISSIEDLIGKTVAVENGYVMQDILMSEFPGINLLVKNSPLDTLQAVASNEADAYIGNLAISTYIINKYNLTNLKVASPTTFDNHNQAFVVRNDWPELVSILNKAITATSGSELSQLRNKWFNVKFEYGLSKTVFLKWITIVIGICLLILLFFATWNFSLRVQIAKRKKTEEQLQESQKRFELAMEGAKDGLYDWNLMTNQIYYSPGWKRMLGYEDNELSNEFSIWEKLAHPDDVEKSWEMQQELVEKKRERFELEFKMKHKNGHWVDILSRAKAIFDDSGKAERVIGTHVDITERKAKDKELKSLIRDQDIILDNVPAFIIFKDTQNNIIKITNSVSLMTGLPKNEIEGRPSKEVYPDMADKYWEDDLEVIRKGQPKLGFVEPLPTVDGKTKWLLTDKIPYFEDGEVVGILVISTDISERIEYENKLKESELRFRSLFENAADAIYVVSMEGKILDVNSVALKQTGFSKKELLSMEVRDLDPRAIEEQDRENIWENIDLGGVATLSTHHLRKDNSQIPVEISLTRYEFQEDIFLLAFVRDVTEKLETQRQLQQAQKMESIGNLAGGIAHEFNNMLAIIMGNNELIMEELPQESLAKKSTEEIRIAGLRARDVVKQLLTFSRQDDAVKKVMDFKLVVEKSMKLVRSSTPANIKIEQNLSADTYPVMGNETQINQLLINLCNNAVDALPEEGGAISIELLNATIDIQQTKHQTKLNPGQYAKLMVSDNGIGMDTAILDRVFEPYFTTKNIGEGTGIGMAVVHGIVERHGGAIAVDSKPAKGTTFTIFFPAHEGLLEQETEDQDIQPVGDECILYVDDEPSLATLGKLLLERLGYTAVSITDPVKALDMIRADPNKFDLLITDMAMPNMTGEQLVIETLEIRQNMPIIICTGYSAKISEKEAADIGARSFIMKPINKSELAKMVRKVLDETKRSDLATP